MVAEIIREIESEDGASAADWSGWQLNVTTDDGAVLVSIALDRPALNGIRTVAPLWLVLLSQLSCFKTLPMCWRRRARSSSLSQDGL